MFAINEEDGFLRAPELKLSRTNTFPRSNKRAVRRSCSETPERAPLDFCPSPPAASLAPPIATARQSGVRRGLSEHFYRLGRGTLDRIGRANRAKRLAGK